jgi:hypothetical protein
MKLINIFDEWKEYRDKFRWRDFGKKKNGQNTTPITILFLVGLFIVIWALFLGNFININSATALSSHSLGGFESFLWSNLNLIIFLCLLIFILAFKYMVT